MRSTSIFSVVFCLATLIATPVHGHGFIAAPFEPRNFVKSHDCPQCANGSGPCGEGGQWSANATASDLNGPYTTGLNSIRGGETIEFSIQITAAHQGHFVMGKLVSYFGPFSDLNSLSELCRPNGNNITHECFNTRLRRDPSDTRYSPYVPEYPEIGMYPIDPLLYF